MNFAFFFSSKSILLCRLQYGQLVSRGQGWRRNYLQMENGKGSGWWREHTVQGARMLTQEHGMPSNLSPLHETVLFSKPWLGPVQLGD